MVNNNNNLNSIIENKKPFEIVQELKDETPSFEEFMKTYENDGSLNYSDLESSSVGESKGYGPIHLVADYTDDSGRRFIACGLREQFFYSFCLRIECHNWDGLGGIETARSIDEALAIANRLVNGGWNNSHLISNEVLYKCANLVREAVNHSMGGNSVSGYVRVRGRFWSGPEWSYSY